MNSIPASEDQDFGHHGPFKILLVGSSDSDLKLLGQGFANAGVPAVLEITNSSEEAWRAVNASTRDLVILGLSMLPGGYFQLIRQIRAAQRTRLVPLVVFCENSNPDDIAESYRLRANACVPKPGNPEEFQEAVTVLARFWCGVAKLPTRL